MSDEFTLPGEMDLWVEERHRNIYGLRFRVTEVLYSKQSEFQKVEVVNTAGFGKMLFNDGAVMLSERDEFIYHEMIAHVPLFAHPNPKQVLVIGGGDGGTAREVLRHRSVEHCTMVEIDGAVVEACRMHIPQTASALDDPKLDLILGDGVKFVAETDKRFDVIIVDSTDPVGHAQPLFGNEFYGNVSNILNPGGIVVSQAESPHFERATQRKLLSVLRGQFSEVHLYLFANLTYPGALWAFSFASKKVHPLRDFDPQRVNTSEMTFNYYSPDIHRGAFALPPFVQRDLDSEA